MGATVTVQIKGKKQTYTIVGAVEANPLEGKISDVSPIGKVMFGKSVGDKFTLPNGNEGKITAID